ncbi:four-carbon acid sugar kinase family protein [Companilactobacillus keshanensis]|uniref:Four-carbon acid sugar kinase family protein n=1 Tax=Companilactobacillus keshanensis TaxID=2486003 RepID=A0ABW4BS45_9LACO|nr:four-carbon acid sugar kinase family protein [Companilactobacillus keshanensis]
MTSILAEAVFNKLPNKPDEKEVDDLLTNELKQLNTKIIVLDDDPTGVQTVHDVSVYTNWTKESIRQGFKENNSIFFILTNSRGFSAKKTSEIHQEIAQNISDISKELNQKFLIISRSDSTLRGHYPLETEVLKNTVESETDIKYDGEVILPFFKEGGRFTIDNVHYVQMDDVLVPAGETEFAKDRTFGYTESDLTKWVEEKTHGDYLAENVTGISLEDLRSLNIDKITNQLMEVKDFNKVVVNAIDYIDVKVFVIALVRALNFGKQFMYRSAAALTKILGGVSDKALLVKEQLVDPDCNNGGLIMIGSHVKKSTEQLNELMKLSNVKFIEFNVNTVLEDEGLEKEEQRVSSEVNEYLKQGRNVAVFTSRKRLDLGENKKEEELASSVSISKAITKVVTDLDLQPKFIIAKGGITSSDIGTNGLEVRHAIVAGQIKPGIPVWYTDSESKFSNLPYIIFPGNVGAKETLKEVVEMLD